MTAGKIDCVRGSRFAGAVFAGLLGAVGLYGSGQPAAADDGQDALNVASLEQLPEGSLADERGGTVTSNFNLNFYLHAIATVSGEVKFQKDIAEQGARSQSTSLHTVVTNTTTSTKTTSAP